MNQLPGSTGYVLETPGRDFAVSSEDRCFLVLSQVPRGLRHVCGRGAGIRERRQRRELEGEEVFVYKEINR